MPHREKISYPWKEKHHQIEERYERYKVPEDLAHGRGHGRSSQPRKGNEMDTYAVDLAEFIEALEQHGITLASLPTVDGEVARSIGRSGSRMSSRQR